MGNAFKIYKSSAGSGKTFTLVKYFLATCLSNEKTDSYQNILAITFTNKAANEMKERIISALNDLQKNDSELKRALIHETGLDGNKLSQRASKTLHHILQNKSRLSISTIDKFLLSIIKAFRRELNLPFDFQTEVSEDLILDSAINKLYQKAREDKKLYKILLDFASHKLEHDSNTYFQDLFDDIKFQLLKEGNADRFEVINKISLEEYHSIYKDLKKEKVELSKKVESLSQGVNKIIHSGGYEPELYSRTGLMPLKFENYTKGDLSLNDLIKFTGTSYQIHDKWVGKNWDKEPADFFSGVEDKVYSLMDEIHHKSLRLDTVLQALDDLPLNYLMGEIGSIVTELKEENATFLLSELNQIIADISINEPVPFIYEFAGERYQHILIDEFQDTSIWQFQGMLPLISECLSKGGTSLIVGDAKQSIYRFRGGEMRQFIDLPSIYSPLNEKVKAYENDLKRNADIHLLDTNYRSYGNIISFANSYCDFAYKQLSPAYKNAYADSEQKNHKEGEGMVSVELFKDDTDEEMDDKLLANIKDILAKGYKPSEICILSRKNKSAAHAASLLRKNNYSISISNSVSLNESPEVNTLIAILKQLNSPHASRAFLILYHLSYATNYSHELLFDRYHTLERKKPEEGSLGNDRVSWSNSSIKIDQFFEDFGIDTRPLNFINYFDFVLHCAKQLNFDFSDLFLQSFLDLLNQHFFKQKSNLAFFLKYWDEKGKSTTIATPKSEKAIEIGTVHKSKGLQFPICILYFKGKKNHGRGYKDWIHTEISNERKLELFGSIRNNSGVVRKDEMYSSEKEKNNVDEINTYYVAITRAEKALLIMEGNSGSPIISCMTDQFGEDKKSFVYWKKGEIPINQEQEELAAVSFINPQISSQRNIHLSTRSSDLLKEGQNPRSEGNIIHFLLSKCHKITEIDRALLLAEKSGLILSSEIELYQSKMEEILKMPMLKEVYDQADQIYSERELYNTFGQKKVLDKLIKKGDDYFLLEFKTGERKTEHKKQIFEYADILNISNINVSKKFLVYTKSKEIDIV
jgi:ATP-dependent exoDNAse (exonuclease V) beta subunit